MLVLTHSRDWYRVNTQQNEIQERKKVESSRKIAKLHAPDEGRTRPRREETPHALSTVRSMVDFLIPLG